MSAFETALIGSATRRQLRVRTRVSSRTAIEIEKELRDLRERNDGKMRSPVLVLDVKLEARAGAAANERMRSRTRR